MDRTVLDGRGCVALGGVRACASSRARRGDGSLDDCVPILQGAPPAPHGGLRRFRGIATVGRMSPRFRRIALALLCVLLIGGLLFSGPGHQALHLEDHGTSCDACHLVQIEAPDAFRVVGPGLLQLVRADEPEVAPRTVESTNDGRPRAPPRCS